MVDQKPSQNRFIGERLKYLLVPSMNVWHENLKNGGILFLQTSGKKLAKETNQTSPYSTRLTMFFCIFIWQASMTPSQHMMS
jgi:hypothetical protein